MLKGYFKNMKVIAKDGIDTFKNVYVDLKRDCCEVKNEFCDFPFVVFSNNENYCIEIREDLIVFIER